MKREIFLKFLLGIVALVLILKLTSNILIEPWLEKKIQSVLFEGIGDYTCKIGKVHIQLLKNEIELENITLNSVRKHDGVQDLEGGIKSVEFKGINLFKVIFKNDIDISEITISNLLIKGKVRFLKKEKPPIISSGNIRIGKIHINKIDVSVKNISNPQTYSINKGELEVFDFNIEKKDTININLLKTFNFKAKEIQLISSDSLYSYKAMAVNYRASHNTLVIDRFNIHPNYAEYDFTARSKYEIDRIEAWFSKIKIHGFNATSYIKSGNLESSYTEIGNMEVKAFRDKRKKFRHINRPVFQDMIYNYPHRINIDSIAVLDGNVTYKEHVEKAKIPGHVNFNKINAKIYNISNDTKYKSQNASLVLKGKAFIMGTGRITILLNAKLFERQNTFSLIGEITNLKVMDLNPIMEKNAFVYATSGKIDKMNFNFTANNTSASGRMTMRYHGLDVAVKNKRTNDTTGIIVKIISLFANKKIYNSNPVQNKDLREGIIFYKRDPEKFLFNYCYKSILSGIKSSIVKNPKGKSNRN